MAENVVNISIQEVNKACYFSILIDYTPDISHIDQLTYIIHYVNEHSQSVVRIDNIGHKSQEIMATVINILKNYNFNLNYLIVMPTRRIFQTHALVYR